MIASRFLFASPLRYPGGKRSRRFGRRRLARRSVSSTRFERFRSTSPNENGKREFTPNVAARFRSSWGSRSST